MHSILILRNQIKCINVLLSSMPKKFNISETIFVLRRWLGYLLTPQGLYLGKQRSMPYSTWINIDYCDMLPSWACILKPLMDQSGLTTYFMDRRNAKGICKMCLLMAANALAACPNHNKWFSIHTNASDFQLGTCII